MATVWLVSVILLAGSTPTLKWSGLLEVRYAGDLQKGEAPDTLGIARARVRLKARLSPTVDIELRVDHEREGLRLQDARVRYSPADWVRVWVGRGKMPFSGEESRSVRELLVPDRGETNDEFEDGGWLGRAEGICLKLAGPGRLRTSLGVFGPWEGPDDPNTGTRSALRVSGEIGGSLTVGGNVLRKEGPSGTAYGMDAGWESRPLVLRSEGLWAGQDMEGVYVEGAVTLIDRCWPLVRWERFRREKESGKTREKEYVSWGVRATLNKRLAARLVFQHGDAEGFQVALQARF